MDELVAPFWRLLAELSPPESLRAIEAGGDPAPLWAAIAGSGYLDALVTERSGGAGLTLADIAPLLICLGRNPVALPVAETMVARALLVAGGCPVPDGAIVLATLRPGQRCAVPRASIATHVLADTGAALELFAVPGIIVGTFGASGGDLRLDAESRREARLPRPADGLRPTGAVLRAAEIAGLGDRLLAMSVDHANQRTQFGKPIGKQQAVQQQLAVMAEKVVLARMAAQLGCAGGFPATTGVAAIAKQVTSAASATIAAIAHAVHGAIGIAAEHDLQLFTRRLHQARLADGAEGYWARLLGERRLGAPSSSSLDFARALTKRAAAR